MTEHELSKLVELDQKLESLCKKLSDETLYQNEDEKEVIKTEVMQVVNEYKHCTSLQYLKATIRLVYQDYNMALSKKDYLTANKAIEDLQRFCKRID